MTLPEPLGWKSTLRGAVVFTLLAGLVYGFAAQGVFYKTDGPFLVLNLADGRCEHPYNVLYMPLLCGLHAVLRGFGATPYQSGVALSVLGAAVGVGLTHVGLARTGLTRAALRAATALAAFAPAMVFFATVVEHHGVFVPFAALTFWLTVELARRPTWGLAVSLGLATHVAYLVHGTGNLLPGVLLPLFLAWRRGAGTLRRDLALAMLAGALHLALFFGLRDVELPGGGADAALASVLDRGIGQPRGIGYLPSVLWHEWIWPFLPISVAWTAAFRRRELRWEASALGVGLVPYLAICVLLIVGEPEFGAYLLPLAIPASRLAVLGVAERAWMPLFVLGLVLAGTSLGRTADVEAQRQWAAAARELAGGRPVVLLVGGPRDIGFALAALPDVERLVPSVAAATVRSEPAELARMCAVFDAYVDAQRAAGKVVLLSAGAREDLAKLPAGPALLEHVARSVADRGAGFWRLLP